MAIRGRVVYLYGMRQIDPMMEMRAGIAAAGSQRQWALANGLSPQYVCDLLSGRREMTDRVLARLGLRRIVRYERIGAESGVE